MEAETKFVFRLFIWEEIPRGQEWGKEEKTNAESSSRSLPTGSWIFLELPQRLQITRYRPPQDQWEDKWILCSSPWELPSGMLAPPHNRKQRHVNLELRHWQHEGTWILHGTACRDRSWTQRWSQEGARQSSSQTGQRDFECYFYSVDIMKHLEIYFGT